MNRTKTLLCLALVSLSALPLGTVQAIDQETADQQLQQLRGLDDQVRAIKRDALDLAVDLEVLERDVLYPDGNMVSAYLSVDLKAFVVETARLLVNGEQTTVVEYPFNDAVSLTRDAAHEMARLDLGRGTHTITLEVSGRYAEDAENAPPVRRSDSYQVYLNGQPKAVEFVLEWTGRRREPRLSPREWASTGVLASDSSEDQTLPLPLQARATRYLRETDRLFTALAKLRVWSRQHAVGALEDPDLLLAEGRTLVDFGLPAEAEQRLQRVRGGEGTAQQRNEAVLRLAELAYTRGHYNALLTALARDLVSPVDEDTERKAHDLKARAFMRLGDFESALAEFQDAQSFGDLPPYMAYNHAITLMRTGAINEGIIALRRVGRIDIPTFELAALRDKANLTLGYQLLKQEQYEDARDAFRRIRLEGEYANKGLLGYGWSLYFGTAELGQDDVPTAYSSLSLLMRPGRGNASLFEKLGIGLTDEQRSKRETAKRLERALVPWSELLARDPMDPAVQEAFVAVPQALGSLGAHRQSLQYYLRAAELLEETRLRLDKAEDAIYSGRMVETLIARDLDSEAGWTWEVRDLPNAPETYYLYPLIASTQFQEALKNYRDLRFLARRTEGWLRAISAYGSRLAEGARPADPDQTVARARAHTRLFGDGVRPELRLEEGIGRPSTPSETPLADAQPPELDLALAEPPPALAQTRHLRSPAQQMQSARPRIFELSDRIETALIAQRDLLETMALNELKGQRRQAEEFLIEARFAMARIFDQQEN